jgi:hypothetical protein
VTAGEIEKIYSSFNSVVKILRSCCASCHGEGREGRRKEKDEERWGR